MYVIYVDSLHSIYFHVFHYNLPEQSKRYENTTKQDENSNYHKNKSIAQEQQILHSMSMF